VRAFWVLVQIVTFMLSGYYTKDMVGIRVDQEVFDKLVKLQLLDISERMDYVGARVPFICFHWFLCILVNILPVEKCREVWDQFFIRGKAALFSAGTLMEVMECNDV
jgi:hypothetical protein